MIRWTRQVSNLTWPSLGAAAGAWRLSCPPAAGTASQAAAEYVIRGGGRTVRVMLIAGPARGRWIPVVGEGEAPRRWTRLSARGVASRVEALELAAVAAMLLLGGDAPAGTDEL